MPWIQTFTGKKFDPLSPERENISIIDIAHALSLVCRFNGHCSRFYSVAEHSLMMSYYVSPAAAPYALLHDASEAYISDVSAPIKPYLLGYEEIEHQVLSAVCATVGLKITDEAIQEVRQADVRLLLLEKEQLMGPEPAPWNIPKGTEPFRGAIMGMSPTVAEKKYLSRFLDLFPHYHEPDLSARYNTLIDTLYSEVA